MLLKVHLKYTIYYPQTRALVTGYYIGVMDWLMKHIKMENTMERSDYQYAQSTDFRPNPCLVDKPVSPNSDSNY